MDKAATIARRVAESALPTVQNGGAGGTRTPYLFNAIEALSQMSYSPTRTGRIYQSRAAGRKTARGR